MKALDRIRTATLVAITRELPAFPWSTTQLSELVDPQLGIITGYQDLLDDLERMRRVDLGALPPAGPVRPDGGGGP